MVYVFLAEGFEEIEALTPVDLLRRAGVETKLIAIGTSREVKGARGMTVLSDALLGNVNIDDADLLVLPGGMPGTLNLAACESLMTKVDEYAASNDNNKRVAAICAAPAKTLGARGNLNGRKATCYPGMESELIGATVVFDDVVTDGNITTSRGLGTAVEFALELVKIKCGKDIADKIRTSVVAD